MEPLGVDRRPLGMPADIARALRTGRWLFAVAAVISLLGSGFDIASYAQARLLPVAPFVEARCPASTAPLHAGDVEGSIPPGFVAVPVVGCDIAYVPGHSIDFWVSERSAPITAALLRALGRPDAAAWPGSACSADGHAGSRYVLLVDADGRAVRPHLPSKPCGDERSGTAAAINDLHYGPARIYDLQDP